MLETAHVDHGNCRVVDDVVVQAAQEWFSHDVFGRASKLDDRLGWAPFRPRGNPTALQRRELRALAAAWRRERGAWNAVTRLKLGRYVIISHHKISHVIDFPQALSCAHDCPTSATYILPSTRCTRPPPASSD